MPRDLPLSNGSLLVAFDLDYQLRDITFPRIGQEDQTQGNPSRFGVWVDGKFSWVGADWTKDRRYLPDTLVTSVHLENPALGVVLEVQDAVDFHVNALVRWVRVRNLEPQEREVRVFFHQNFNLYGSDIGDSCFYDPDTGSLIHYKGQRWFLACGKSGSRVGADQWACGQKEIGGAEGTYRDAEDGSLSGNPVSQGSVDSVLGLQLRVAGGGEGELFYWLAAGRNAEEVRRVHDVIVEKGPSEILGRTSSYWKLWCGDGRQQFGDLSPAIAEQYRRSLLILRSQIDNGGAIIAANDSDITLFAHDTYSYMWPRDGAIVCDALTRSGISHAARRFFHFCNEVIRPEGFLMQKYNPDGSLASSWHSWFRDGRKRLPIQEDETALLLWALRRYFERHRDVEFIKPFYRRFIIGGGEFLCRHRDEETLLPLPSHDLWEERYGIHTWTVAATIAGLRASAAFAAEFGERAAARRFTDAASQMADALRAHLWNAAEARFARMATRTASGYTLDMTLDASLAGVFKFVFPADDPQVASTMEQVRDRLRVRTDVGGWARYENDGYYQVEKGDTAKVPGNPWFVCSFWVAEWLVSRARAGEDLSEAREILDWAVSRALPSGVMAEQLHPYTGQPLSVSPLTWSHAAFVTLVQEYASKQGELQRCGTCGQPVGRGAA